MAAHHPAIAKNRNVAPSGLWANPLLWGVAGVAAATTLRHFIRRRRQYDLAGKVVLITGGARGLGLVLAREFARHGARLALCARDADELARGAQDLRARGAEVWTQVCDVTNETPAFDLIAQTTDHYGTLDVLVNNAGVIQVGPLETQTKADFEEALAVHFWGPLYTMQAALPLFKQRGAGRIVNIASFGGKVGVPHLTPYCASKFALVGLSSAMRAELVKDNIFITTVCPGLMRTGSHLNAKFKGQNEYEYAWFSLSNSTPPLSVSAEKAARQIVQACQRGDASLDISAPAQLAVIAQALAPELVADLLALSGALLPASGGIGTNTATGRASASWLTPPFLTALSDQAALRNNEM